ncbi:MAG: ATP-dependent sacrificial sulfur transferase LarE [Clostridia bacterium]|nr:ATP-dependent sacrificial sulfur transferase LarE [Clostridia bacterium]
MDKSSKKTLLENYIKEKKRVAVAFSSGVDSTFLLKVAHDVLKENAIALTVRSNAYPARETAEAKAFCESEGIEQIIVDIDEMKIEGFSDNPKNRCYLCKRAMFSKLKIIASERGFCHILEGTNADDTGDYRPGLKAIEELNILSPLKDLGFTKAEIRELSKEMGLSTFDKPSYACLASRFTYGEKITEKKLSAVESAEEFLRDMGFLQVRVRVHGELARVEILPEDFARFTDKIRVATAEKLFSLGFKFVTLDLVGYKTGSMNKTIND